jgi:dephospho-CoA kinase
LENKIDNSFKHAVVLTGGIATGKSTVASLFKSFGFLIIDADKIAHHLLNFHSSDIASLFGNEYVDNGVVVRKKLGFLIFNNEKEKLKLEKFIHPLIKKAIIEEAKIFESQEKPYLIDIPLFFEKQHYNIEKSIVVYTSKETQIERLMKRDNSTREDALSRINNQMDIEEKKLLSTYLIDNNTNLKALQSEVERIKSLLI